MGSYCQKIYKLWPLKRSKVKLPKWFPKFKWYFEMSNHVQKMNLIQFWKVIFKATSLPLKPLIWMQNEKVVNLWNYEICNLKVFKLPLENLRRKWSYLCSFCKELHIRLWHCEFMACSFTNLVLDALSMALCMKFVHFDVSMNSILGTCLNLIS